MEPESIWANGDAKDIVLELFPPCHLLDLGGGSGWLQQHVPEYKVTNIDRPFDLNKDVLPNESNSVAGVVSFQVIEHLENPHHFVREIFRVLKPGARAVITTPNPFHIFNKLTFLKNGEMFRYNDENDHVYVATKAIARKLFRQFASIETRYQYGYFPYRWLSWFAFPANELFARNICWILRK